MPDSDAAAWLAQARARQELGDWPRCLDAAQQALRHAPDSAEASLIAATALLSLRRPGEAAAVVERVIGQLPDDGGLQLFHARCLMADNRFDDALGPARLAVARLPLSADAHYALGACLKRLRRFDEARPHLERTVAAAPDRHDAWNDLGDIHVARGELAPALDCFRRSHAARPYNVDAMSALCFYAAFDPDTDAAALAGLRRDLGSHLHGLAGQPERPPPAPPRADGRLRIGYIAYDMGNEVTSWFLEPVLARHDRSRFHIAVYHGNAAKDDYTARLEGLADAARDIAGETPQETASRIRADGIDILVLASFYNGKDHRVLAWRPAPLQAGYLNRVATTGLEATDYLLTEALPDPPGRIEQDYTERLVRLSELAVYLPPQDAPPVSPCPFEANGHVTFGSFNNHIKIVPAVIDAWSAILRAVPDARLILRSSAYFNDPATVAGFCKRFAARGIGTERLDFQGVRDTRRRHLEGIGEADIALDPFPGNGGTTTCESLYMGLPLVTLVSDRFMGRQGLRYLARLGLDDLAADTIDGYVAVACRLARDQERLRQLRATLRPDFTNRMMDYDLHVRELEAAYSHMWKRLRNGQQPTPFAVRDRSITP
jgi:protein O-GlcNAc transferase